MLTVWVVSGYLLGVPVLIERSELDEGTVDLDTFPSVEADDDTVRLEEDVVIRFLQGLRDRI